MRLVSAFRRAGLSTILRSLGSVAEGMLDFCECLQSVQDERQVEIEVTNFEVIVKDAVFIPPRRSLKLPPRDNFFAMHLLLRLFVTPRVDKGWKRALKGFGDSKLKRHCHRFARLQRYH